MIQKSDTVVPKITGPVQEKIMQLVEVEWENGSKGAVTFHAFDLQVIKLQKK